MSPQDAANDLTVGGQPLWRLLRVLVLMGVSSIGPCCPHGPHARGSPEPGSGAGRKPSLGKTSAMSTPPVEPHAAAWPWTHPPTFDPLPPPRGVLNSFLALPDPGGEHMVVLRTLRVPFNVGTGPCCGADAPCPTSFMLFPYILINAVFTAGAFPVLVPSPS